MVSVESTVTEDEMNPNEIMYINHCAVVTVK